MHRKRSLVSDGAWVAVLQGLSALGQLIGVRLLTEILSPSVFGQVSLWLGAVALASAAIANPTMQALLRFYPEYFLRHQGPLVKAVARHQLSKLALYVLPPTILAAVAGLWFDYVNAFDLLMLALLVVVDIARMGNMAYMNALRAFRPCGIWGVIEAWGRPICAYFLVSVWHMDTSLVLLAFLVASATSWFVMRRYVPSDESNKYSEGEQQALAHRFWLYTLPLLPLGLIGWVSGMADRYMIGALLTPADVGLYVALYGLASRPVGMLGGIIETTVRPAYQQALVEGNSALARRYLKKWALLVICGSCLATAMTVVGHSWIASLLLGSQYQGVSELLPWIVGGYSFLILSHVANRVCYANEATKRVFIAETAGAIFAVVIGFFCILQKGLWGAATAVPAYFGAQLILSYVLARPWLDCERRTA
ncbi:lipopolysaccharide biosynthesis protein [Azoarcus sp. KH32C]|uniref:lipopolysaccharide biosynthesis protein n=1 Tax=Azoarcus sp. KH32C TaxID=748247 RepID=UPI0005A06708|nr:lipopolysaccharide biosynthesis protein [Azoarcus sp. KH32C]